MRTWVLKTNPSISPVISHIQFEYQYVLCLRWFGHLRRRRSIHKLKVKYNKKEKDVIIVFTVTWTNWVFTVRTLYVGDRGMSWEILESILRNTIFFFYFIKFKLIWSIYNTEHEKLCQYFNRNWVLMFLHHFSLWFYLKNIFLCGDYEVLINIKLNYLITGNLEAL